MMGFTHAYEHILPPIRNDKDMSKIFGSADPLLETNRQQNQAQNEKMQDLAEEIEEIVKRPFESIPELNRILQQHILLRMQASTSDLSQEQTF